MPYRLYAPGGDDHGERRVGEDRRRGERRSTVRPPRVLPPTPRQIEALALVAAGLTHKEAAARLGVAPQTVKQHLYGLYGRLGVRNAAQAVAVCIARGLLAPNDP